ncbi:AraC-like DNA-binding protein [Microbacterium resistens]|uniref:AraC-like DNA-binding protein n=1 Tax=Microbacterium resistens TaxID=156977 RepID=A0ABU1SD09_9MICO|nr:helix-turn-helix domain-containing protein [Microbacterium resistens]MDR6867491.1 AraC-like DNA-binding protein [Microbacterium resistens]
MNESALRLQHLAPENAVRFLGHSTHAHEVPHLIHVAVGTAHVTIDGVRMTLRAHESVWLAAGVPHAARYEQGSLVLGPFLSDGTVPPARVLRLGVVPEVTAIMTTILGVAPHSAEQIEPLRAALDRALMSLGTSYFVLTPPVHPVISRLARAAVRSNRTLAELADGHGVSERHVQRVFREETGLSFRRWRAQARLNIAIARLRGGEQMAHVARATGYRTRSGLAKALAREVDADDLAEIVGIAQDTSGTTALEGRRSA